MQIKLDSKISRRSIELETSVQYLVGVGPKLAAKLNKLGIFCVEDLLLYYPRGYQDFTSITRIGEIKISQGRSFDSAQRAPFGAQDDFIKNNKVTIQGQVSEIVNKRTSKRRFTVTEAIVEDESGSIKVVWFNQPFLTKMLRPGRELILNGKVGYNWFSKEVVMESPERAVKPCIVPIYPETTGITSAFLRRLIYNSQLSINKIEEHLLQELIDTNLSFRPRETVGEIFSEDPSASVGMTQGKVGMTTKLLPIQEAIKELHFPTSMANIARARRRIAFDELFLISLRANLSKEEIKEENAPIISINDKNLAVADFLSSLPFKLTGDQRTAAWQILKDMNKNAPMNRLLNGDVGSGKTVVAAIAALVAIKAGYRVAIMCPTSILANQHYKTFCDLFAKDDINIGLFTSDRKEFSRCHSVLDTGSRNYCIDSGSQATGRNDKVTKLTTDNCILTTDIIIGTHALIQESVKFENLGLVVVDEQHRFGVAQRAALQQLGRNKIQDTRNKQKPIDNSTIQQFNHKKMRPHFLSMTATPIPRTLHLALFGDLDISVIREKPADRKEIKTRFVSAQNREKAYQFVRAQITHGRQAFVICPLIEEKSEALSTKYETNSKSEIQNSTTIQQYNNLTIAFDERKSVKVEFDKLQTIYPEFKIGMLHGKMKAKEKDVVMADFVANKTNIIVSTSVVEVGVDIPNASVMVIEDAERFGLAQIHQFRGRVGRAEYQSFCFLFSPTMSEKAILRLKALESTSDGFKLAEIDLETRGPGAVFGTEQSGLLDLKMATLADRELIEAASTAAKSIVEHDPELKEHPLLKNRVSEYLQNKHLE